MNNETPSTPEIPSSAPAPAPHAAHPEIQHFRKIIEAYGTPLAVAVAVLAMALIGLTWYRSHSRSSEERAYEMLGVAGNTRQLEEIRSQYPATAAAQIATLMLAKAYYDAGNYGAANGLYTEFEQKHPQHPMADAARMGKIHCLEAMGQTEAALEGYSAFASANPNHYLAADAMLGKARTLEQIGKLDEARTAYEDYIAAHPRGGRVGDAQRALAALKEKMNPPAPGH